MLILVCGWMGAAAGGAAVVAALAAWARGETVAGPLASTGGPILAAGAVLWFVARRARIQRRAIVPVAVTALFAATAAGTWILAGAGLRVEDALFESASGWTTTGASVLQPEEIPGGLLLFRALMQWLGGLGFVAAALTLLHREELPVHTRLSMRLLVPVYAALTAAHALLLILGGADAFESVCLAMSTVSTGGFQTRSAGIGQVCGAWGEWVTACFMLAGAVSFVLYLRAVQERSLRPFRNEGFVLFAVAAGAVATVLAVEGVPVGRAFFLSASYVSTTGFLPDSLPIPPVGTVILFLALFVGGMVGSTSGGIKARRWLIVVRSWFSEMLREIYPYRVFRVRVDGVALAQAQVAGPATLFILWVLAFALASAVLLASGETLDRAVGAAAAALNNVAQPPPGAPWSGLDPWARVFCALVMIAGRVEILPLLAAVFPSSWRQA